MSTFYTTSPNGTFTSENKTKNGTFDTEAGNVVIASVVYLMLAILIVIVIAACIYVWTCGPKAVKKETSTRRNIVVSSKTKKSVVHSSKRAAKK